MNWVKCLNKVNIAVVEIYNQFANLAWSYDEVIMNNAAVDYKEIKC